MPISKGGKSKSRAISEHCLKLTKQAKSLHTLGSIVAATLETTRTSHEFDYDNEFMRCFFEVSSVVGMMLPSVWWP